MLPIKSLLHKNLYNFWKHKGRTLPPKKSNDLGKNNIIRSNLSESRGSKPIYVKLDTLYFILEDWLWMHVHLFIYLLTRGAIITPVLVECCKNVHLS